MKLPQLVLDLLLGAAGHLGADPLAIRAVAERHLGAPPPKASFVVPRISAVAGVVEVDRVFTETTPSHSQSLTLWLPTWLPNDLQEIALCLCAVELRGLEPLASRMPCTRSTN